MATVAERRAVGVGPLALALVAGLAAGSFTWGQGLPETFVLVDNRPEPVVPVVRPLSLMLGVPLDRPVQPTVLPAVDTGRLIAEDAAEAAQSAEKPLRYGIGRDVAVRMLTSGRWDDARGGGRVWTADIVATG